MIIEDEEPAKEDFKPKVVGRGLEAELENEEDEQWYLADSEHPLAPFPGNALKWESFVYADGTSYEGLVRENIPHGKGVMVFGTGTGAGIHYVSPGDKYEGEFFAGFANGLGSYTSTGGDVYRGEWLYGKRHGCGALTSFAPFFRELRKGTTPEEAWKRTKAGILSKRMRYGEWEQNSFIKEAGGDGQPCSVSDVRGILQEMESVVTRARMFQHKPDGDATILGLCDRDGVPIPVFQDPLHYPHGTKFLAPGPLGQCHPVPEGEELRSEMRKHARNYLRIYNQYNLPFLAKPGDDLFAASRLHEVQRMQQERFDRMAEGEDEDAILGALDKQLRASEMAPPPQPTPEPARGQPRRPRRGAGRPREEPKPLAPLRKPPPRAGDDSDLIASSGMPPPSIFCSISSASQQLTRGLAAIAETVQTEVLPRVLRRPSVGGLRADFQKQQ